MPTNISNGNASVGAADIDLRAAMTDHVVFVDLDDLLEAVEFCGLPQRELVVTYVDANNRRRYVERCPERKRNGRKGVAA